jgi:CTP-dependent riboflavin kinase
MLFNGTVKTGIGGAVTEISNTNELKEWEDLTGLKIIPGTLNLHLEKPFDLTFLKYLSFSEIGWDFDPSTQGHDFNGDIGMYYHRINIADTYPGIVAFWTWVPEIDTNAELISSVHLRTVLGLKDGDKVSFCLHNDQ